MGCGSSSVKNVDSQDKNDDSTQKIQKINALDSSSLQLDIHSNLNLSNSIQEDVPHENLSSDKINIYVNSNTNSINQDLNHSKNEILTHHLQSQKEATYQDSSNFEIDRIPPSGSPKPTIGPHEYFSKTLSQDLDETIELARSFQSTEDRTVNSPKVNMSLNDSLYNFSDSNRYQSTNQGSKPSISNHVFSHDLLEDISSPKYIHNLSADGDLHNTIELKITLNTSDQDLDRLINEISSDIIENAASSKLSSLNKPGNMNTNQSSELNDEDDVSPSGKCSIPYLGTLQCVQDGDKRCTNLHCINCDFHVSYFDNHKWTDMSDNENDNYLFLRNNYPEKVHSRLVFTNGWTAYCCQCTWEETNFKSRAKTRRWVCGGHVSH